MKMERQAGARASRGAIARTIAVQRGISVRTARRQLHAAVRAGIYQSQPGGKAGRGGKRMRLAAERRVELTLEGDLLAELPACAGPYRIGGVKRGNSVEIIAYRSEGAGLAGEPGIVIERTPKKKKKKKGKR